MAEINSVVMKPYIRAHNIKKGDIITFKAPFNFKGEKYWQIGVMDVEVKKGAIRLIGFARLTRWYKSFEELNNEIDWEQMDKWHK
jgi:hypothetical protein